MKILNISDELREGLAITASMNLRGHKVLYVLPGSHYKIHRVRLQTDTGSVTVKYIEIPVIRYPGSSIISTFLKCRNDLLQQLFATEIIDFDIVVTSSSYTSFYLSQCVSRIHQIPLLIRISDLGIVGKFNEAIKLFHYYNALIELPPGILRLFKYVTSGDIVITHTHAISKFVEHYLNRRNILIYPTYVKMLTENSVQESIDENYVDMTEHSILGIVNVKRPALSGKHDRKALECLYTIAKYNPSVTVTIIGTSYKEACTVLGKYELPPNLKLLGAIRNDLILEHLYKNSSLIVIPFFFRKTISNRLLEALFYGKPALIPSSLKEDFPMLKHEENTYMFDECDEAAVMVRYLLKSSDVLDRLEKEAKLLWEETFSNRIFGLKMNSVLSSLLGYLY
ncbi:MAG: hypothetical protein B7O98_08015 [Zestosphaera tikiterensis]|uniref:Glycosyl transferase family 1 domain-containing protein n=1 Tax=Zestosphaera tikiterensis TaxID=1973259 RepID=A0A2R7Y327_9CREN|nr:MAG: hypothetical protein B7O98_08015 [Zestosphaera tikiterensis]